MGQTLRSASVSDNAGRRAPTADVGPSDRRAGGGRTAPARRGPTTSGSTRSCSSTATGATSPTATGTGPSRRSVPTSTLIPSPSRSPSRTGRTTSTSAPSCATRTRSGCDGCTSSGVAAGTGAVRWSPTGTCTSSTTRRSPGWSTTQQRPTSRWSASTTWTAPCRWSRCRLPRRSLLVFGQEGPGLSDDRTDGRRRWSARSRCTAPRDRSTPGSRRASHCTRGCASTPTRHHGRPETEPKSYPPGVSCPHARLRG